MPLVVNHNLMAANVANNQTYRSRLFRSIWGKIKGIFSESVTALLWRGSTRWRTSWN